MLGILHNDVHHRIASSVLATAYLYTFGVFYESYISVYWAYTGLFYRPLPLIDYLFIYISVFVTSYFLPTKVSKPSSIIIWFLAMFVYVPTMSISLMVAERPGRDYLVALSALSIMIALAGFFSSLTLPQTSERVGVDRRLVHGAVVLFIIFGSILVLNFYPIMRFSGIETTYDQRQSASELTGGVIGYVMTYFVYVISTFLFAVGLTFRRLRFTIALGLVGFLVSYSIDASKISLVLPIAMSGCYFLVRFLHARTNYLTAGLVALTIVAGQFAGSSGALALFADIILVRAIAIPGQTFALYSDLFKSTGYTWWSHVSFIDILVAPPSSLANHPYWPSLGRIVGTEYFGANSTLNANANLFVGDGVAAAGALGVILIGAAFIAWLLALDYASRRFNSTLAAVVCVPIGMGLSNVHFSTLLLSFGGALWVLMFYLHGRSNKLQQYYE